MGIQARKYCQQRLMEMTTTTRARNRRTGNPRGGHGLGRRDCGAAGRGLPGDVQVAGSNRHEPDKDPDQARRAHDLKRQPPAARLSVIQEQNDWRRGDRTQRGTTLENAVAQWTLVARQQPLRGRQRTGPLPGLEETQQDPAEERARCNCSPIRS